jgi:hypothetical protein
MMQMAIPGEAQMEVEIEVWTQDILGGSHQHQTLNKGSRFSIFG